jgi:NAD(P)-dependent dehydrogenase (short-subunit alcohol dehydrogenase family)
MGMANVLITGCSSGIGQATARHLAGRGWTVYATARRLGAIEDLAADGCQLLELDVTDEASMVTAVGTVERNHGAVDALVNNAGYGEYGPVEEVPLDAARREFETNVFGLARMAQLVLPGMRRQRHGRIVNVGSMGGRFTFPGGGWYHASKYAVEALSDALRFEVRRFGIHVALIEPGTIKTQFATTAVGEAGGPEGPDVHGTDGPYASFNAAMAKTVHGAYEGALGRMAVGPEAVAKVIEKALTSDRPRARYPVTVGARVLLGVRKVLPDRAFDAVLRTQFASPGD